MKFTKLVKADINSVNDESLYEVLDKDLNILFSYCDAKLRQLHNDELSIEDMKKLLKSIDSFFTSLGRSLHN